MQERHSALEAMALESVEALPPGIRERLSNLAIAVEDWPRRGLPRRSRPRRVARRLSWRPADTAPVRLSMVLPNRIVIFEGPLQRLARDEEHLRELVRHTVQHEIAHHFGISDARLRELGAY